MAYTAIPDTDLDAESPAKTGVMTKLRDNAVALYEDTRASAYKASTETVTADTTLQDDDDISWAVGANETWVVQMCLLVTTGDAAGDLDLQLTTPGGGASGYVHCLAHNGGTAVSAYGAVDAEITVNYSAARTSDPLYVTAYVTTVDAGTCKLEWAQNAASSTTSLLAGSWFSAFRTDDL